MLILHNAKTIPNGKAIIELMPVSIKVRVRPPQLLEATGSNPKPPPNRYIPIGIMINHKLVMNLLSNFLLTFTIVINVKIARTEIQTRGLHSSDFG